MKLHIYSLKTKIALLVLLIVTLALVISGLSIYTYMYGMFTGNIVEDNKAILANISQHLAYTAKSTEEYARNIIVDNVIQDSLRIRGSFSRSDYNYYSNINKIDNRLSDFLSLRDNIGDIYIVDPQFEAVTNKAINEKSIKEWYSQFMAQGALSGFAGRHSATGRSYERSAEVISYITTIHDKTKPGEVLGFLVIDLKYAPIANTLRTDLGSIDLLYLYSKDNILFSYSRNERYLNKNRLNLTQEIPGTDWRITGFINKKKITQQIWRIGLRFSLILIACFIPLSLIILPVVNRVIKPVYVLIHAMKEYRLGRLKHEIEVRSHDELGLLANGFNFMVRAINQNMEDMVLKQKKERELELQLLMKQLNPHFIYNTLNCIIYLARRIEAVEIVDLTRSFIMLLQHIAKMLPDETVSLKEELHFIRTYIHVLKYRYEDKVHFEAEIDPLLEDLEIPKLLLYPIVENSIFHGLLPLADDVGKLKITAGMVEDEVEIAVTDNGIGFPTEQLEEIQKEMKKDYSVAIEHIGLRSVYQRLMIHYGHKVKLSIESEPNMRTRVSIRLRI